MGHRRHEVEECTPTGSGFLRRVAPDPPSGKGPPWRGPWSPYAPCAPSGERRGGWGRVRMEGAMAALRAAIAGLSVAGRWKGGHLR